MGSEGVWASQRRVLPAIRPPTVVLCPQQVTDMCTTHRMGRDGHGQQFDTTSTLISAPQWPHRPCYAPMQPYRVVKKPSVKADLAMYSHTVDVSRQCMSVLLILGCKLDFSSCAIRTGFTNPVTYSTYVYRKSGNFYVEIIHVVNIHVDLLSWVYGTHKNILIPMYLFQHEHLAITIVHVLLISCMNISL